MHLNSKYTFFIFASTNFYKKFCKNVILSRYLVVFVAIILQSSLYCTGHLKNKKKKLILEFLTFLLFNYEVILGERILNNCKATFSKLVFSVA